jgi:pyruvate,orthophosphate dikinase
LSTSPFYLLVALAEAGVAPAPSRQMGKACIVSCAGLDVDVAGHQAKLNGMTLGEGDWISLDGDTGEVFLGQREIMTERPEDELAEVERWRADTAALELAK